MPSEIDIKKHILKMIIFMDVGPPECAFFFYFHILIHLENLLYK